MIPPYVLSGALRDIMVILTPKSPQILHGLARELFEETGLKLTKILRAVGEGIEFKTGDRRLWMKLSFEIEVLGGVDGMWCI